LHNAHTPPDNVAVRWVICDLGGTLTDGHGAIDDAGFVPIFREFIERGVRVGAVTARNRDYAIGPLGIANPELLSCFSFVFTGGGSTKWEPPDWKRPKPLAPPYSRMVVSLMRLRGVPSKDIWPDWSSIGTWSWHEHHCRRAIETVERVRDRLSLRRLDLEAIYDETSLLFIPHGMDKHWAILLEMAARGVDMKQVLVCANGPNDHSLAASVGLAVVPADAHSSLRKLPRALVAEQPGSAGVKSLLNNLLADRIPGCSVGRGPGLAIA